MTETNIFQRLERTANLIARHPYYPGKHEAIRDCITDIEGRCRDGLLTIPQKSRLVAILLEGAEARAERVRIDEEHSAIRRAGDSHDATPAHATANRRADAAAVSFGRG